MVIFEGERIIVTMIIYDPEAGADEREGSRMPRAVGTGHSGIGREVKLGIDVGVDRSWMVGERRGFTGITRGERIGIEALVGIEGEGSEDSVEEERGAEEGVEAGREVVGVGFGQGKESGDLPSNVHPRRLHTSRTKASQSPK